MISNYSLKVLGETGEGRLDDQAKHSGAELVDDGAASVLENFLNQGLVRGGVGLELGEDGLGFHRVRCVRCRGC